MNNPLEIIARTRRRLAQLAVVQTTIRASLPLAVTLLIALQLETINGFAFEKLGYLIGPSRVVWFRTSLFALVLVEFAVAAVFAWRAWVHGGNFLRTAERIDSRVGGRQEILTLAALADPAHPEAARMRSALFPMLWRRTLSYLDMFEPRREFKLEILGPLERSLVLGLIAAIVLGAATIAVMRVPTQLQAVAFRLRQVANSLGPSTTAPNQLAMAARDVAHDLENPGLPPEQKLAELQALKQELEKAQPQRQSTQSGKGNSSGDKGSGKGNGGKGGGGSGSGSGAGQGSAASGSGATAKGGGGLKGGDQMAKLQNDISKAQINLEQAAASGNKSQMAENASQKGLGIAPKSGNNPNQPGNQKRASGTGAFQLPQPSAMADNKMPSGGNHNGKNDKGSIGDTHLGEFPKGGNYQRYYKLGEGGPAINIRNARYVTFQLPAEIAAGTGALVPDTARPSATTPYTNAPLKEERLPVSPDEQQLVPPRYRELIH